MELAGLHPVEKDFERVIRALMVLAFFPLIFVRMLVQSNEHLVQNHENLNLNLQYSVLAEFLQYLNKSG